MPIRARECAWALRLHDQGKQGSALAPSWLLCIQRNMTDVLGTHRFVLSKPLVASAVIGATTPQQLREILSAAERGPLSRKLLAAIDDIHQQYPNPNP